ncbi:MAG: glycosyltransferase [Patescibacteria group bacterium]
MEQKIALVHDYFFQFGGAEKVVEKFLQKYPYAHIHTSIFVEDKFKSSEVLSQAFAEGRVHTTWLQHVFRYKPLLKFFKHLFWLYPLVMSAKVVKNYQVVVMSSTYCAKNVRYENCSRIIHYCHSPTRFLHGLVTEIDHNSLSKIYRLVIPLFTFWLKWMDLRAVSYLNQIGAIWVGNSKFVSSMIKEVYKTESIHIYPPTEIDRFLNLSREPAVNAEEFYFCHGRISFHKRIDLAILACLQLGRRLKISGQTGFPKEMNDLKRIVADFESQNPSKRNLVEFLGRTTNDECAELFRKSKAFLFPGKEDAGIAPIESFASGVPVIAYKAGGALEYLVDDLNGVFFEEQSVSSLVEAMLKFENKSGWDVQAIRESSLKFSPSTFYEEFEKLIGF